MISEYKENVREIVGPILNKTQTGLEDVPTCHNQLTEELTPVFKVADVQRNSSETEPQQTVME